MVLLSDAVEAKKFDVRVIERNINRGVIKSEDAQKNAQSLPDDGENADWVSIDSLIQEGTPSKHTTQH